MKIGLVVSLLVLINGFSFAYKFDSLRTEKEGDNVFIIHQVDPKETLYSISRRYNVPIREILNFNPAAKLGLNVGSILKVPYVKKDVVGSKGGIHIVKPSETLYYISNLYEVSVDSIKVWNELGDNALTVGQKLLIRKDANYNPEKIIHGVKTGETLFSISKLYETSVEEIKNWNKLEDNNLSIGQNLMVGYKLEDSIDQGNGTLSEEAKTKDESTNVDNIGLKQDSTEVVEEIKRKKPKDYRRVVENGLASVIEGSGENKKYLALHRSAEVGTILQIRNEMTNRVVFVRVIGQLPNTGINEGLILRLSQAAYDRIGALDKKFRVEISYVP